MGRDEKSGETIWTSRRIFLVILASVTALVTSYYLIFQINAVDMGYLYYYYFDLLSSQSATILLAFFAGVASFFSPCAFALLPGYMSYYLSLHENTVERKRKRLLKSVYLGALSALGILTLYSVSGAIVAFFGASVQPYITIMQPIVGTIIIGLGLVLMADYPFNLSFLSKLSLKITKASHQKNYHGSLSKKLFLYGVGYGATAAACTAPIFVSLMIYSAVSGGLFVVIVAFLTYSITMGAMMVIITLLVALAKEKLLNKIKTSTLLIKRVSGLVLMIAGVYLIFIYINWFISSKM